MCQSVSFLFGLLAKRCDQCGSTKAVNVDGVPICGDCGEYSPADVIEHLVASPDSGRLRWAYRQPDFPPEDPDDVNPQVQMYVSQDLNIQTFSCGFALHDILTTAERNAEGEFRETRFRRLDRKLFRWLAVNTTNPLGLMPLAVAAVDAGVLGDWALNEVLWNPERVPADWRPFEAEQIHPALLSW